METWFGDGMCDDHNNNEKCQFDGGDCSGEGGGGDGGGGILNKMSVCSVS